MHRAQAFCSRHPKGYVGQAVRPPGERRDAILVAKSVSVVIELSANHGICGFEFWRHPEKETA
jgi:hypothetical protein